MALLEIFRYFSVANPSCTHVCPTSTEEDDSEIEPTSGTFLVTNTGNFLITNTGNFLVAS